MQSVCSIILSLFCCIKWVELIVCCVCLFLLAINWKSNVKSVKDNMDYNAYNNKTHAFIRNNTQREREKWIKLIVWGERGIEKAKNDRERIWKWVAHSAHKHKIEWFHSILFHFIRFCSILCEWSSFTSKYVNCCSRFILLLQF